MHMDCFLYHPNTPPQKQTSSIFLLILETLTLAEESEIWLQLLSPLPQLHCRRLLSLPSTACADISKDRPRPDPFLIFCTCFSFLTATVAVICVFVNVLSAVRSFKNGSDIFDGIFRCYTVAIALFVAVAESEWSFIIKFWRILDNWAGRGMLQIFVAVMTRAFPDDSGQRKELVLIQDIASYLLLACGVIYVISALERRREELEELEIRV